MIRLIVNGGRTMRKFRSFWCGGLIGGVALFALGPTQMDPTQPLADNAARSDTHAAPSFAHAPLKLLVRPDGLAMRGPHNEFISGNWSGYAVTAGGYTSASLSWIVPAVSFIAYPSSPAFESSSSWVGIGGFGTSDLIQLGTEQYVDSTGATTYQAWYELLPATETPLPSQYTVSPGDVMSASLACTSRCTANRSNTKWHLSMTNSTQNWTWTGDFTYKSSLSSAEWIQEAPTYSSIVALPGYGPVKFSSLLVNGGNPNLSLSADGIILQDAAGGVSTPCAPQTGISFLSIMARRVPVLPPPTTTTATARATLRGETAAAICRCG
jgi:hypothetical protein